MDPAAYPRGRTAADANRDSMPDLAAMLVRSSIGTLAPGTADRATTAVARRSPASACTSSTRAARSASSASRALPEERRRRGAHRARARERAPARRRPARRLARRLAPLAGTMAPRMREVTVSTVISAPREEVFDFVCDLAARPAFTRPLHARLPARARPARSAWAPRRASSSTRRSPTSTPSCTITEVDRPRQIVEEIRVGRRGRNRSVAVYDFSRESARRHAGGADHLQRAGHDGRPPQGDRRRRLDAAQDARRRSTACA